MTDDVKQKHKLTPAEKFKAIFELFVRGATPGERAHAETKMKEWLKRHRKDASDISAILLQAARDELAAKPPPPPSDPRDAAPHPFEDPKFTPAGLVEGIIAKYVSLQPHELVAVTLWTLHTHIFENYMVTPRLALISPVRECGKTTMLDLITKLGARTIKSDGVTAAALYHATDEGRTSVIDEGDNMELALRSNATLRLIMNSGHRKGGSVPRMIKNRRRNFNTFAPLAFGSIGGLHPSLMSRCIIIHMSRYSGDAPLRQFDINDTEDLDIVYSYVRQWARTVQLNRDPEIPEGVRGRSADNWRALIAIADSCGEDWGARARAAAVALSKHQDEESVILLFHHILAAFDTPWVDRMPGKVLCKRLGDMEDAPWGEWTGLHDNQRPHRLTTRELARLLRPFRIYPRPIWPLQRTATSKSARGYMRSQFEDVWRDYCGNVTTSQPQPIKRLRLA
jgi:Protein of unknown function (DUF3631)